MCLKLNLFITKDSTATCSVVHYELVLTGDSRPSMSDNYRLEKMSEKRLNSVLFLFGHDGDQRSHRIGCTLISAATQTISNRRQVKFGYLQFLQVRADVCGMPTNQSELVSAHGVAEASANATISLFFLLSTKPLRILSRAEESVAVPPDGRDAAALTTHQPLGPLVEFFVRLLQLLTDLASVRRSLLC